MIEAQYVNVPGPSGKIILKLECWPIQDSEVNLNFTFMSLDEREKVKLFLNPHMHSNPPCTTKTSASTALTTEEIQVRQALLLKHTHLAQMHRQWVVERGLLSEEEFWNTKKVGFFMIKPIGTFK